MSAEWVPEPNGNAGDDWKAPLIRNRNGAVPVLANAVTAFRSAPEWQGVLAFDEFALRAVICSKTPWGGGAGVVTDHEDRLAADWLQRNGVLVSPEIAGQAIQLVARDRLTHPVREYLRSLKWDGTHRIDGWLSLYLGVEPTAYTAGVGARWLISAVARILQPGVKADCCLILEGEQGIKKSTALRKLGQPWFTDELADLGSKDAALQTAGIWLIEIAELDGLTRAEVGKIKAFMSRTIDRFRPPYGRHLVESARQCVFAGSVNHSVYLRDETGGRRFWPVACKRVLIEELERDRDQLWAEAVHAYLAGATWWLETSELNTQAEDEQASRYEGSAWDALIIGWSENHVAMGARSVSIAEILERCIQKRCGEWTRADEMRVGACLRSAKWIRYRDRRLGWQYKPPFLPEVGTALVGRNVVND